MPSDLTRLSGGTAGRCQTESAYTIFPDKAATTHPAVIEAVCRIFVSAGADVMIAESNGRGYSEGILRPLYRVCGMEAAAENSGAN